MEIGLKGGIERELRNSYMPPMTTQEKPESLHLRDWLKDTLDDINTGIAETKLPDIKLKGVELSVSCPNGHIRIVI